jgi:hypothetical protein
VTQPKESEEAKNKDEGFFGNIKQKAQGLKAIVWDEVEDNEFEEEAKASTLKKDLVKAQAKNKK